MIRTLLLSVLILTTSVHADSVDSFTLINAATDVDIRVLTNGATINLAVDGSSLNVRANTLPATVGSVRFGLDANPNYRTENAAPYALEGDSAGNYNSWTPSLGAHTLTATPYTGSGATGTTGTPLTVNFTVINDSGGGGGGGTGGSTNSIVTGELKQWHRVTVSFVGPDTGEAATPNPFRDYRLNVTFTNNGAAYVVPGFYAADGNAAETGATTGNVWRAHFTPNATGTWSYVASFRTGPDIAISTNATAGIATATDGAAGSFVVAGTDKSGRDHRGKGWLQYVGQRYLRFAATGEYFLKGGADSPENFLGYFEFDGTTDNGGSANDLTSTGVISNTPYFYNGDGLHHYEPHTNDWTNTDPVWQGSKGKGIIGALNYLASVGMNSVYFLTMNVNGDGREVYPWTGYTERYRFDCSKLDQWEIVFSHMDAQGLQLHVITQEQENDQLLDGGALGVERQLYYRELIARYGHHPALVWNLGEENTNTDTQRQEFCAAIRALDCYRHPIVVHTYPGSKEAVYAPLLGFANLEGPSLQNGSLNQTYSTTTNWVQRSAAAGKPWVVCLDENGPANIGVKPDSDDAGHDSIRQTELWGNLMAGGAGCEWYFGYSFHNADLDCEDWRSRAAMWAQTGHALEFFQQFLPFPTMVASNALTSVATDYCFAKPGDTYAIYLPNGGTTDLDLGPSTGTFNVRWYDPRNGGSLQTGTVTQVTGPGNVAIGNPPAATTSDWVALVRPAALTPYQQWRLNQFTPAELADPAFSCDTCDPDGDGLKNLAEYAFGSDPKSSSITDRPSLITTNGYLALQYWRPEPPPADIQYTGQSSSNLVQWMADTVWVGTVDNGNGTATVIIRDNVLQSEAPRRFLRLIIQSDP